VEHEAEAKIPEDSDREPDPKSTGKKYEATKYQG
jgi:hypothetical protein